MVNIVRLITICRVLKNKIEKAASEAFDWISCLFGVFFPFIRPVKHAVYIYYRRPPNISPGLKFVLKVRLTPKIIFGVCNTWVNLNAISRGVTTALIGGGGGIFIYSCSARRISF